MTDQYEVIYDLLIGAMFNDLERPITQMVRWRWMNMAQTEQD